MKIVDRRAFLALPAGTLFHTYDPEQIGAVGTLGPLKIKGDTSPNPWPSDWLEQEIPSVPSDDPMDSWCDLDRGAEIDVDLDVQNSDRCFDEKERFLIWSRDDVVALQVRLAVCLRDAYPEPPTAQRRT